MRRVSIVLGRRTPAVGKYFVYTLQPIDLRRRHLLGRRVFVAWNTRTAPVAVFVATGRRSGDGWWPSTQRLAVRLIDAAAQLSDTGRCAVAGEQQGVKLTPAERFTRKLLG